MCQKGISCSTLWRWISTFESLNSEMKAYMNIKKYPARNSSDEIAALKREIARLQQEFKHEQ